VPLGNITLFTMTRTPHVTVSTCVFAHEVGERCVDAVLKIFPDFSVENMPQDTGFPVKRDQVELLCEGVSPDRFLELLAEQRILDTALDAMSLNLGEGTSGDQPTASTSFLISRQAALSGKVAFVLESDKTVGGVIEIELESIDLADWIQEATWHSGRREVPREVGDDLSMRSDGGVTEWFDRKGRPTIHTDD